ncbi:unnamed protein product, partial [Iphiclides podalirius]
MRQPHRVTLSHDVIRRSENRRASHVSVYHFLSPAGGFWPSDSLSEKRAEIRVAKPLAADRSECLPSGIFFALHKREVV